MSSKQVMFADEQTRQSYQRNGIMRTIGLDVEAVPAELDGTVYIAGMTERGGVSRSYLALPLGDVPALIAALQEVTAS